MEKSKLPRDNHRTRASLAAILGSITSCDLESDAAHVLAAGSSNARSDTMENELAEIAVQFCENVNWTQPSL